MVFNVFCKCIEAGMFGMTNIIPKNFSFNDQIFTTPPPTFLTFLIFLITSCGFEAAAIPLLHKYHCSLQHWPLVHTSIWLFFAIESKSKFSRNSTLVFERFVRLSMLVTSTSVFAAHSVIISQTKSILGFGTAVKSILFDTTSSRADEKLINGNGFISDLAEGMKFLLNGSFLFITLCKIFSIKV